MTESTNVLHGAPAASEPQVYSADTWAIPSKPMREQRVAVERVASMEAHLHPDLNGIEAPIGAVRVRGREWEPYVRRNDVLTFVATHVYPNGEPLEAGEMVIVERDGALFAAHLGFAVEPFDRVLGSVECSTRNIGASDGRPGEFRPSLDTLLGLFAWRWREWRQQHPYTTRDEHETLSIAESNARTQADLDEQIRIRDHFLPPDNREAWAAIVADPRLWLLPTATNWPTLGGRVMDAITTAIELRCLELDDPAAAREVGWGRPVAVEVAP